MANGGQIYRSTDSGFIWTAGESNRSWWAITSSADGSKLAAAVSSGQIYTFALTPNQTTVGTAGAIRGDQYDAVGLQYLGSGTFMLLDSTRNSTNGFVVQ